MAFAGKVSTRRAERERERTAREDLSVEYKLCLHLLQFAYANSIAGTRDYDELTVYERLKMLKVHVVLREFFSNDRRFLYGWKFSFSFD